MSRTPTLLAPTPQLLLDEISVDFRSQLIKNATREISPLHKPESTAKPIAIDWSKIAVWEATTEEARTIAEWAQTPNEALWLGAAEDHLKESTVRTWIEKSWGAFVLYETDGKDTPVAFANVALLNAGSTEFRIEVGRLLVPPTHRRQGLGSTLVQHLSAAVNKTIEEVFLNTAGRVPTLISTPSEINVRAMKENDIVLRLIKRLPFLDTISPLSPLDPHYRHYHWFKYLPDIRVGPAIGGSDPSTHRGGKGHEAEALVGKDVGRETRRLEVNYGR